MESTDTILLVDLARLLFLMLAISCGLVAAASYWRRHRTSMMTVQRRPVETAPPAGIVYNDAPTVRVVDSQRVDRLRKIVRLRAGEFVDVLETRLGSTPRFRVTLKSVVSKNDADAAHIVVEFGGTAVSCGPLVQEVAFNEFVLPRVARDEPRSSVFHYQEHGDALDFMRIKLRSVDMHAGTAELDMMQVSGRWPAG